MIVLAHTTTPTREIAIEIGERLLELKVAACISIQGPVTSMYHWKGAIETAEEYILIIKTLESHKDCVSSTILEKHPYETPELIWNTPSGVEADYAQWINDSVSEP